MKDLHRRTTENDEILQDDGRGDEYCPKCHGHLPENCDCPENQEPDYDSGETQTMKIVKPEKEPERIVPSGTLMVPEGSTVVKLPPRSRTPVGYVPTATASEIEEIQRRVYRAVLEVLPPEWHFFCALMGPNGEREVVGNVEGSNTNRKLLDDLQKVMGAKVWREPKR
jgi:hypothetical protein